MEVPPPPPPEVAYDHYNYMGTRLYVSTQNSHFSYSNQQIYVKNHNQNHFQSSLSRFYVLARRDNILVVCFSWTFLICKELPWLYTFKWSQLYPVYFVNRHSCIFPLVAVSVYGKVLPFLRDCYLSAVKTENFKILFCLWWFLSNGTWLLAPTLNPLSHSPKTFRLLIFNFFSTKDRVLAKSIFQTTGQKN